MLFKIIFEAYTYLWNFYFCRVKNRKNLNSQFKIKLSWI